MPDVDFTLYAVPNRYQDVVQRMAVLSAIRQPAWTSDQVRELTVKLIDQWRARVGSLTSAGWEPSTGNRAQHSILYARNCRPAFVMTSPPTRPCRNVLVCPWCYARWVRDVWAVIDTDMPAPDPPVTPDETTEDGREYRSIILDTANDEPVDNRAFFRFHLLERHHTYYRPLTDGGRTVEQTLTVLMNGIAQSRKLLVDRVDPIGAFIYTTIEPWERGQQQWKIHNRQVFKLTPEQDFPADIVQSTHGRVTRYERPTRKEILRIIARTCRYPVELITGDADLTARLIMTRRAIRFRGHERFRSFRGSADTTDPFT